MTLQVFTARISCRDPDRFDVTRKSGGPAGHVFAPSWDLLGKSLEVRRRVKVWRQESKQMRANGRADLAEAVTVIADAAEVESWEHYVPGFMSEMRASYRQNRADWDDLLAKPRVVLACYCASRDRCHRGLLAERILPRLNAVDCGELTDGVEAA